MTDPFVAKVQAIIRSHLPPGYQMFLFGSRATAQHHRYSDVDIGIEGKKHVPHPVMTKITAALEESDVPVRVDVVDFTKVTPEFSQIARQTRIAI